MAKIVFEWKKSLLETGTEKTGGRKGPLPTERVCSGPARRLQRYLQTKSWNTVNSGILLQLRTGIRQ